jgi:hypothetical protein
VSRHYPDAAWSNFFSIEGGGGVGYAAFVNTIRSLSNGASKKSEPIT